MKKLYAVLIAAATLAAAWMTAACGRQTPVAEGRSSGTGVSVVSLAPALTELVFQLGCGDALAGRTDVCNKPSAALSVPVIGQFGLPVPETVLRLKPDLILANALVNPRLRSLFEQAGCRVILKPCDTLEDYQDWVRLLGEELKVPDAASAEINRIRDWLTRNGQRKASGKKVLFLLWDEPVMAAGAGTLPDTAIRLAGGVNILGDEKGYVKCSPEFLQRTKDQVDYIIWAAEKPFSKAAPQIRALSYPEPDSALDVDSFLRPGPRFTDGVDALRGSLEGKTQK